MKTSYIVLKCPRCKSTSEVKIHGVTPDILSCPVCLEGDIDYRLEKLDTHKTTAKSKQLVGV